MQAKKISIEKEKRWINAKYLLLSVEYRHLQNRKGEGEWLTAKPSLFCKKLPVVRLLLLWCRVPSMFTVLSTVRHFCKPRIIIAMVISALFLGGSRKFTSQTEATWNPVKCNKRMCNKIGNNTRKFTSRLVRIFPLRGPFSDGRNIWPRGVTFSAVMLPAVHMLHDVVSVTVFVWKTNSSCVHCVWFSFAIMHNLWPLPCRSTV
jgi:hypothetical protein